MHSDLVYQVQAEMPTLYRFARSLTRNSAQADDLVQDCMERAISNIHQFRPGTNLRSWLFTILSNLHKDECRKRTRRGRHLSMDDYEDFVQVRPRQADHLEVRSLIAAFGKLNPYDREVLILAGVRGMKYETIACRQDVAVGTVKSRLSRARQKLRLLMDGPETPAYP
jgi:RNA polymerase sigma-70 factor, ECF subfamily